MFLLLCCIPFSEALFFISSAIGQVSHFKAFGSYKWPIDISFSKSSFCGIISRSWIASNLPRDHDIRGTCQNTGYCICIMKKYSLLLNFGKSKKLWRQAAESKDNLWLERDQLYLTILKHFLFSHVTFNYSHIYFVMIEMLAKETRLHIQLKFIPITRKMV